jgi:hypothetical protein
MAFKPGLWRRASEDRKKTEARRGLFQGLLPEKVKIFVLRAASYSNSCSL